MAITSFTELKTALATWSHRSDLTSVIPDFIVLAEAKLNRNLRTRDMEASTTLTPSAGVVTLPTDYLSIRRLYINSSTPIELEYLAPEAFYLQYPITAPSSKYYTIEGGSIILADRTTTTGLVLLYHQKIPDLATNTTNWLLTSHPDLYLSASMAELFDYVKNSEEMMIWSQKAQVIADSLRSSDMKGKFSGSAMRVIAS